MPQSERIPFAGRDVYLVTGLGQTRQHQSNVMVSG
jgi:hypothetical protein